jgi:Rieske 2Fe-2S family protein
MTPPLATSCCEPALLPFGESTMLPPRRTRRRTCCLGAAALLRRVLGLPRAREAVLPGGRTQVATTVGDVGVLLSGMRRARSRVREHLPAPGTSCSRRRYVGQARRGLPVPRVELRPRRRADRGARFRRSRRSTRLRTVWSAAAAVWHGWVFVNALGTAAPLRRARRRLEALVAPYARAAACSARARVRRGANWKVVTENYHECYHCPLIHPELCQVSPPTSGTTSTCPGRGSAARWTCATAPTRCRSTAVDGRPIDGVDPRACCTSGCSRTCCCRCTPTT